MEPVSDAEREFYNRGWWGRAWPLTARIAIEFDSAFCDAVWWHPWIHFWKYGMRVGVLGVALVVGVSFYIPKGMGPPGEDS